MQHGATTRIPNLYLVHGLNTTGGIAGTLLTGFLLVPALGLVRTLSMLAITAATVGVLAVLLGPGVSRKMKWAVVLLALTAVAGGMLTASDRLVRLLLTTRGGGDLIFYQESRGATVGRSAARRRQRILSPLHSRRIELRRCPAVSALHAPAGHAACPGRG